MNASEMISRIEDHLRSYPERMSGNEINARVAEGLRGSLTDDRAVLIAALREYLSFRKPASDREPQDAVSEARLWMALDVAEGLKLTELCPDVESLLDDVRRGKVLRPVHQSSIARYLGKLVG